MTGGGPVNPPHLTISGGEELRQCGLRRPGGASGSDGPEALVRLWTDQESERTSKEGETGLGPTESDAAGPRHRPWPPGDTGTPGGCELGVSELH
ncbi:hypothetical protein NDU88_006568 [Pleurodeles waltl]|uniref:Uncharacterized protein n=1 Tax=Pleurodeles waltl TaxID=8319 RepID=A0AAV7UM95_PLEWA|nr:hypothetical protein NDU88_006568 [Pleurodeles waltl]